VPFHRDSPPECNADRRPAQTQALDVAAGFHVVADVAPGGEHVPPAPRVPDAGDRLPRELRLARADVGVVGDDGLTPVFLDT